MISAYPHIAFVVALLVGTAAGFIIAGFLRTASECDDDDGQWSDYTNK